MAESTTTLQFPHDGDKYAEDENTGNVTRRLKFQIQVKLATDKR